ncbi:MAG: hypothetical protein HWN68_08090 [Desulfobacterales bacterium]|nr:hypothetical protein [Desulfobacterales bacterium]
MKKVGYFAKKFKALSGPPESYFPVASQGRLVKVFLGRIVKKQKDNTLAARHESLPATAMVWPLRRIDFRSTEMVHEGQDFTIPMR